MNTFLLSFLLVGLAVLAMASGVLLGRKPISGSCGGGKEPDSQCGCKAPCSKRLERMQVQDEGKN